MQSLWLHNMMQLSRFLQSSFYHHEEGEGVLRMLNEDSHTLKYSPNCSIFQQITTYICIDYHA